MSRKPLISALIWHPENGRGIIRRAPRSLAAKSIFCWILWARGGFLTLWLLWHLHALIIMSRPLTGWQIKAKIKGFNMAPWKGAWHYQEGVTMTCRKISFFTSRPPMLFAARRRGVLLMMPRPLLGCQIKAEIQGFLLMYSLFLY